MDESKVRELVTDAVRDVVAAEVKAAIEPLTKSIGDAEKKSALLDGVNEPVPAHLKGGGFFIAVKEAKENPTVRVKLIEGLEKITKAPSGANTLVDSEGGFLVPEEISNLIADASFQESVILDKVDRFPIGNGNRFTWPEFDNYDRSTAGSVGGIRAYRTNEGTAVTYTKPKIKKNSIDLSKLMALVPITEEALVDAVQMEGLIMRFAPIALSEKAEDEIFNGTGGEQCQGVLSSPCLVSVAKENNQAAATVNSKNLGKMLSRMPAKYLGNSAFFVNYDVMPQLQALSQEVGTGGIPVFLPPGGLSQSPFSTLYGRPIIPTDVCKTLGTVGDIVFADMKQYILADKGGVKSTSSMHVLFTTDEQMFKFVWRVNGMPKVSNVITPRNGSNTLSPFIVLATRS